MKITKNKMKKVGLFFPEKTAAACDGFSYASYIEDVNAFRSGILQGYLEDFRNIPLDILYDCDHQKYLDNSFVYNSKQFNEKVSRIGDLDINIYDREIESLHKEFASRVLAGEPLELVDKDISLRMQELATRNNDGTHNSSYIKVK